VALALRFRVILIGCPSVEDLMVVDELDVPRLEIHVEAHLVAAGEFVGPTDSAALLRPVESQSRRASGPRATAEKKL
jgi:hypothetical protein